MMKKKPRKAESRAAHGPNTQESGYCQFSRTMHQPPSPKRGSETPESQKIPFLLVKSIREAILDEVFKPGDHLTEAELVEKFEV
jgi:hypothetical protein